MARRRPAAPFAGPKLHRLEDRLAPAVVADVPEWAFQGPQGVGTVTELAPHPTDPNIAFAAGGNGGLWRTTNAQAAAGPTWTPLTDRLPSLSIADLSLNPANPNELVFGVGTLGGGTTGDLVGLYTTSNALAEAPVFTRLTGPVTAADPQGAFVNAPVRSVLVRSVSSVTAAFTGSPPVGYILAGGANGVYIAYRRADGSVDPFTRLSGQGGLAGAIGPFSDIVADPANPKRVYVVGNAGAFRTDDLTAFAPAAAGAAAKFPTFADLGPALTTATGGTAAVIQTGTTERVRVALHSSTSGGGAVTSVPYVGVVNPASDGGRASIFYATDALHKLAPVLSATGKLKDVAGKALDDPSNPASTDYLRDAAGRVLTADYLVTPDGKFVRDLLRDPTLNRLPFTPAGTFTLMDEPVQISNALGGGVVDATYASPVSLKTAQPHGLQTGERVLVEQLAGNAAPNGVWTITVTGDDTFTLNDSAATGKFVQSNATIRHVFDAASDDFDGQVSDSRFGLAADPVNPNLVYLGGGDTSRYGLYVGEQLAGGRANIVRGDRSRPRLNGLVTTDLIANDVTFQWTSLVGGKAAGDSGSGSPFVNIQAQVVAGQTNPDGTPRVELLAGTVDGVYRRVNPQINGSTARGASATAKTAGWSNLSTNLSLARVGQQVYDPIVGDTFNGQAVDAVTTPGKSFRYGNVFSLFDFQADASSLVLSTPTDAKNFSVLDADDKIGDSARGDLLIRPNVTRPTNPGSKSSGAGRVMVAGAKLYEDDFADDGIGNIAGDITPAGYDGRASALAYGGRQPGAVVTVSEVSRIQYVETPRVAYVGTDAGQLFVRGTIGGFTQAPLPGTGTVNDIAVDPDDWRVAYVLRNNSAVYRTTDGGLTFTPDLTRFQAALGADGKPVPLTLPLLNSGTRDATTGDYVGGGTFDPQGNVADGFTTQLFKLALFDAQTDGDGRGFPVGLGAGRAVQAGAVPGFYAGTDTKQDVLLVGGKGGVFRLASLPNPVDKTAAAPRLAAAWSEYGTGLPNAPVTSLSAGSYTTADPDTGAITRRVGLAIGTSGRGVYVIADPARQGLNDIAQTASAGSEVGITGDAQNTTAPDGRPLAGRLDADPSNSAYVTVTDGLGNSRTFERTVIQGFTFTGTDLPDTVTVAAVPGGDLQYVRFPVRVDLRNTAGDRVVVANGRKSSPTVVTVDTADQVDPVFQDVTVVQTLGGGPADNLFNTAAGGKLTIAGLSLGTLDFDIGQTPGVPLANLPANQVFVRGTAAGTTRLRVGPRDAVEVTSVDRLSDDGSRLVRRAGRLDYLVGDLEVLAAADPAGASQTTLLVSDAANPRGNAAAVIGRQARADGAVFGSVTGVGGLQDLAGVFFQNVAELTVLGSTAADAAEQYTVADPPAALTLDTGDGPDTVNVQAVSRPAGVTTGAGNDLVRVSSRAGVTNDGDLGRIAADLAVEAGAGDNRLVVSNAGSVVPSAVTVSRSGITGAAAGAIGYAATGGRFVWSAATADQTNPDDQRDRAGVLYIGSNLAGDQITLASALGGSQTTVAGRGGPDSVAVAGDDLGGADVRVVGGGGGDTVTVAQGSFGVNANSLQVDGTGTDTLVVQGYDQKFRTDFASIRIDGNGSGAAFVDGGATDVRFTGQGRVTFDGLAGKNNLTVVDNTNTVLGSAANPAAGIVYAPLGEASGEVRLGALAPLVGLRNVTGGDADGLVIVGDPTGTGKFADTLTVVGPSETGLGGTGTLAGLTATTAASTITVSDRQVVFETSQAGPLRSVALGRVNGRPTLANLVVLAGNQSKQGDQVTVTPSKDTNILVNGQGPTRSGTAGNVLTVGTDLAYTLGTTASPALGGQQTRVNAADGSSFGYRGFGRLIGGAGGNTRSIYAVGADVGGGPRVRVYDALTNEVLFDQFVYEERFTGGVRVATGDVTGDGVPDLITAAGPGGGPRVSVYDGVTFKAVASFFAYEETFRGGLYLAVGDLDGDGSGEIVTGTGVGGGPLVKAFDAAGKLLTATFAFENTFRGGVRVAVGDVTGDGTADLITTAGPGGGPIVRVFDPVSLRPVIEYFAADPTLRTGLAVAAGDLNGDGVAEIVYAPASGPVGAATVRRGDGSTLEVPLFQDQPADPTPAPTGVLNDIGGVRLATADATPDGLSKVFLAARGPGFPSKVYRYFIDPVLEAGSDQAFEDRFVGGVWVG